MGLFKSFRRLVTGTIESIGGTIGGLVESVGTAVGRAAPAIRAAAPIAQSFIAARTGGLLAGTPPSAAGGAQAVIAAQGIVPAQCPAPGVLGSRFSPISNAAVNPAFNPNTLPARPFFGAAQIAQQQFQTLSVPFPQTTSFNQGAFGASVGPSFRPFAPSFRSGQVGVSGPFTPGISRGLDPQLFGFGGF